LKKSQVLFVKNIKKYIRKGDKPFAVRMKGTPVHV